MAAERAGEEMCEAGCNGTVQAEDGAGGSTQAVGVEAEAATQCTGAEQDKEKQHDVPHEL